MTLKEELLTNTTKISGEILNKAINEKYPNFQVIELDNEFWVTTLPLFKEISKVNQVDKLKYVISRFDCENFALAFKSDVVRNWGITGVGIVVDVPGKHAYNMLATINEEGGIEINLFEPQNDQFIEIGTTRSATEHYTGAGYVVF